MAKKNIQESNKSITSLFSAIESIQKRVVDNGTVIKDPNDPGRDVVDIITFCMDPKYLDLSGPSTNIKLYLSQRVVLKCFYMGTVGNKKLSLDEEEWKWLYKHEKCEELDGITYENNVANVIRKMTNKEKEHNDEGYFRVLQLVLGRRSGKTFLASIITAYEAYKVLIINNGDPHAYYQLPYDDEIAIINVALSQKQAGRLFGQIQSRLRNSPFFKGRIAKETTDEIRILTDSDIKKKQQGLDIAIHGSVLILCGHSNADSLAGYNTILLLFDEIAYFPEEYQKSGTYFYNRLKPSLSKFNKYNASHIVQISSPNKKNGIFYDTFRDSVLDDTVLSFQLPTWSINPDVPYDDPEAKKDRRKNIDSFAVEYGAQWSEGGTHSNFFPEGLVERCIRGDIGQHRRPMPGFNYYMHVDPARGGNNYCAVMVAKEYYVNRQGVTRNRIFLSNLWIWKPVPGLGLIFNQIDKEVAFICSVFHPIMVTYDDYQSTHSLQYLSNCGVNTQCIPFNRAMKRKLYQNLKDLMSYTPDPEVYLYDSSDESHMLVEELKALKFKEVARGISIVPDKHGDVSTDDFADAFGGACAAANEGIRQSLPMPVVVRMPYL